MKIKEDLVYDKSGERLHGFVNLGDINSALQSLESETSDSGSASHSLATHMLTIMVRGLFFKLEFPYANFPTQGKEVRVMKRVLSSVILYVSHLYAAAVYNSPLSDELCYDLAL